MNRLVVITQQLLSRAKTLTILIKDGGFHGHLGPRGEADEEHGPMGIDCSRWRDSSVVSGRKSDPLGLLETLHTGNL